MSHVNDESALFNKKIKRTADIKCEENILFSQLNLKEQILKGLLHNGFKFPSPIQIKAIPMGLLGLDLIIQAKSGTGKTCVFSVIALECIKFQIKVPQVIIISPTREIAFQSLNVIKTIGCFVDTLNCGLFIGGIKVYEDLKNLKNCQVIVGTPGRIKYLIEENHIQTESIRLFILDEADMLFTNNFQNAVNYIYNSLPMNKQMITLSATYTEEMIEMIVKYMNSPVMIRLSNNEKATLLGIRHYFKLITEELTPQQVFWSKTEILLKILSSVDFQQCIVFSNYQSIAQDLCDTLESRGWSSAFISGNLDQKQRIDIYNKLKNFHCRVLITTDLSSRGIDAENVNLVINLGIPWDFETYLHRMGRAGRYGSYGVVINIVTKEECALLHTIKEKCCFDLSMLPDELPCDLLDNPINTVVDTVEVEKLDKNKSGNMFELFRTYASRGNEVIPDSRLRPKAGKSQMPFVDFHEILQNYKTKPELTLLDNKNDVDSYFNLKVFRTIEQHIYSEKPNIDPLTDGAAIETDRVAIDTDVGSFDSSIKVQEELTGLQQELLRLSAWSEYYSRQFQLADDKIVLKTQELQKLLPVDQLTGLEIKI